MDRSVYIVQKKMDEIWHIYSDGTRADIPFDTDEDKVYVWNSIAISVKIAGIRVLVATINDTHLHALILGENLRTERFRQVLKKRLSTHYPDIYLARDPVPTREEALSKFMYVYRNCLDFYQKLPGEYPWGCGHLYFSEKRHFFKGRKVSGLSGREKYRLFRTHHPIPSHWQIDEKGRILPETFVDYQEVERFFRSARAFIAFLYVRKEDESAMKQEIYHDYLESRSIQELRKAGNKYCVNYCGKKLAHTPFEVRLKVAGRMLREGLAGRNASLAKALFLQPDDLRFLL